MSRRMMTRDLSIRVAPLLWFSILCQLVFLTPESRAVVGQHGGDQPVYAEGRRIEEAVLEKLIRENERLVGDIPQEEVDIDLIPEEVAGKNSADSAVGEIGSDNSNDQRPPQQLPFDKRGGQGEYVTFLEPVVIASSAERKSDVPVLKRAEADFEEGSHQQWSSALETGNFVFLTIVSVCTVAAVFGLVVAGVFWYRIHKQRLAAEEAEYPQYGVIGPAVEKKSKRQMVQQRGDQNMAYDAQLHMYQQTKQKIISMDQAAGLGGAVGHRGGGDESGDESNDDDVEAGDFSVYECPGLAPTGDVTITNPLFQGGIETKKSESEDSKAGDE